MEKRRSVLPAFLIPALGLLGFAAGCGSSDEPYKPVPAWSGKKANLPPVPALSTAPVKSADSYTIYGAIHHMRSVNHNAEVTAKEISLIGYIVDSNIASAPACAVHKTGKKDPDGCVTEIPAFTLADAKGDIDPKHPHIKVMGWASNFANVFDAIQKYKNLKEAPKEPLRDEVWSTEMPFPLPAVGAKVKVTGKYGVNFAKSSSGIAADPLSGIMTYTKIEVLEPAPEPAAFATAANDTKKK